MSNYELYEHKKSDTVKWVLTLIAFIVVGVLLAGLIAGWFDKGEDTLPVENEAATIQDGGMSVTPTSATGVRLMMGASRCRSFAACGNELHNQGDYRACQRKAECKLVCCMGKRQFRVGDRQDCYGLCDDNAHGRGLAYGDTRLRQAVLRAGHSYRQRDG